jgi:hypothetical protein
MSRLITIAVATTAAVVFIASATRVAVFAQAAADTHGMPPPAQLRQPDSQKTVPIKAVPRPYDMDKLLSRPALSPEARSGQALWQQRCAYCHDGMGQPTYKTMGPWIDSDTVKTVGPDALKAMITAGTARMPSFKYDLNAQQMNDILEFLKTVSPSLRPTPGQLEGKSDGGGNAE